ncbi:YfhO family protein, partial [Singulisphaera rosea]
MSQAAGGDEAVWRPEPRPWGKADAVAIGVWTLAIVAYFWDVITFQKALFYFDITEINFPYRDFFASELRAGRFSRWFPGLYCGMPLFSESQAGYLHPLKYLFYPWMASWKAFSLDTVASIWLTGFGTYGWLRRHVGPSGALTGAAVFGLGGFLWAHLIHTSMLNALASVPFIVWALEVAWERGRGWPIVLGALALACQVFAGHLQDTILTSGMVGLYSLYRAATERGPGRRTFAFGAGVGLVVLGIGLSAVQWIPSKELLDRSPRSGGLTWEDLTYGSWNPELLPTLIVREAYGTRARDTDWPDGYYPFHEMNAYLGVIAMGLAIVGAGAYRDRWVAFWVLLTGVGCVLMLGRFTALFDYAHRIPVFGSSRIPVRYHLWVSLAVAALAAVGVDRLARPGIVGLRTAGLVILAMVVASIPILAFIYAPIWTDPARWTRPYHLARYRWLGKELAVAT